MTDRELVERGLLEDDVRACEEHCSELERELAEARAQLAGAVPIAELRHLVGLCEAYARGEGDVTQEVLDALREFVADAERRAGEADLVAEARTQEAEQAETVRRIMGLP